MTVCQMLYLGVILIIGSQGGVLAAGITCVILALFDIAVVAQSG